MSKSPSIWTELDWIELNSIQFWLFMIYMYSQRGARQFIKQKSVKNMKEEIC